MIKNKLNFVRHVLNDNLQLKEMFIAQYNSNKNSKWIKQIKEYMNITKLNIESLEHRSTKYINKTITQYDNKKWTEEIKKNMSDNL